MTTNILKQKTLLNWYGGKFRMRKWILEHRARYTHEIYVEPFGGGASVLLAKEPVPCEVYNDLDGRLVDHAALVERMLSLQGAAVLSGYENDLYKPLLKRSWAIDRRETSCCAAGKKSMVPRQVTSMNKLAIIRFLSRPILQAKRSLGQKFTKN